ncbi:MAG: ribosome assembly cofactor RimP [Chlorobi bacterium]|nr:ribosome assembly cofactor RimP [Chlorobiota bacterium]
MISNTKIKSLVEQAVKGTSLFAVEISVGANNNISVTIDGEQGVNIGQCVEISRFIEGNLDRETEDFSLGVSSYGIEKPIVLHRQYNKYIDKTIELHLNDGTVKRGILESFSDSNLIVMEEVVKKSGRKSKKMLVGDSIEISLSDIKLAKGIIIF